MAVGFQCWDDQGREQISESLFCLSLRAKNSVEATANWVQGSGQKYYDIVVTNGTYPIIAIHSTTCHTAIMGVRRDGNTWTFTVVSISGDHRFTYYVFDKPENKPTNVSGYGFEIRNGAGEVIWDALQYVFPFAGIASQQNGFAGAAGRKYAHLYAARTRVTTTTTIDTFGLEYTYWGLFLSGFKANNTGVEFYEYQIASGGNQGSQGPDEEGSIGGDIIVLDVTAL